VTADAATKFTTDVEGKRRGGFARAAIRLVEVLPLDAVVAVNAFPVPVT